MLLHHITYQQWYNLVRDYTLRLVNIRSVSPGSGEIQVVQQVLHLLREGGLDTLYTEIGLDPLEEDTYGRQNAYAFLQGQSPHTLVLLGHIDTVDTQDYGPLAAYALDPLALSERQEELLALTPDVQAEMAAHAHDWMFGRGVIDMKSGVAANIAIMRQLAEQSRLSPLPLSVVLLATPDEEHESAGVLQAVRFLLQLRARYGLTYVGAINTDYTAALYLHDPHRYVYTGTTGKLLSSFLIIGREAHAGEPFEGLDANLLAAELIRDVSMNQDLCDVVRGQITPPPVTLHATDLKTHYDVQLPFAAYFYLNVLTFYTEPAALLAQLRNLAEQSMARVLERIERTELHWLHRLGQHMQMVRHHPRSGSVLTYADLYTETAQKLGKERVASALNDEWQRWPADLDKRQRSLYLVYRLWMLSGRRGPAIVLYYSPPYYPHVATTRSALHQAVAAVVNNHSDLQLVQQEYYPYISDMSYLRLDPGVDLTALIANMPLWQDQPVPTQAGGYSLPLETIRQLNLPVVNFGPYGRSVHQRGEAALMSYSFGILPQLLYETIEQLIQQLA